MNLVQSDLLKIFLRISWMLQSNILYLYCSFIMLIFRTLILKKEEEKSKFDSEEYLRQIQQAIQAQQSQIDRMENQIQLLLQLRSNK